MPGAHGAAAFFADARRVLHVRATYAAEMLRVPVVLDQLLGIEGLGEVVIETAKGRHGGLRRVGGRDSPVVYRSVPFGEGLSPRERFTVVHEVAHAIVQRELQVAPSRSREYWALEDLCNEYAAAVLMPDWAVAEALHGPSNAREFTHDALWLARRCAVSHEAAFKRAVASAPGTAAWGLRERRGGTVVGWSAENPEILGLRPGTALRGDGPLANAVPPSGSLDREYIGSIGDGFLSVFCRLGRGAGVVVHVAEDES